MNKRYAPYAFEVRDEGNEDCDEPVLFGFSKKDVAITYLGVDEDIYDEEEDAATLIRRPELDKYWYLGHVPAKVLVEELNYWMECGFCYKMVDQYLEDEEGNPVDPIFDRRNAYCCEECYEADKERTEQRKIIRTQVMAVFRSKFPRDVQPAGVLIGDTGPVVDFRFPGIRRIASWNAQTGMCHMLGDVDPLIKWLASNNVPFDVEPAEKKKFIDL